MNRLMALLILVAGLLMLFSGLGLSIAYGFGVVTMLAPESVFVPLFMFGAMTTIIGAMWSGSMTDHAPWPWFIERKKLERRIAQQEYLAALRERERVLKRAGLDFTP